MGKLKSKIISWLLLVVLAVTILIGLFKLIKIVFSALRSLFSKISA